MFPSFPLAHAIHVKEMYKNLQVLLQKNMLWRTLVEYLCWPESHSNADWAARWIHKILLLFMWMGQPREGMPLQNKIMATLFRSNTRSEESGTSCFNPSAWSDERCSRSINITS
jgi:hypothetical protein